MISPYGDAQGFPQNQHQAVYEIQEKVPPMPYGNQNPTVYMTTAPPPPQTTYIQVKSSGWQNMKGNTVVSAMFLFMYGGMEFAQGLGWSFNTEVATTNELRYSWFVGVMIGAVLSALAVTHLPKLYLYCIAILLELIDGIIFTSASYNEAAIVAARYIGGIGIGLATVVYLIHHSEIATSKNRGMFCGMEQYSLALGISLQVILVQEWGDLTKGLNLTHGICGIVLSVLSLSCVFFSVESPIFYLRRNDETMARNCQLRHLNTVASTNKFNQIFEEAKSYVAESSSQSIGADIVSSVMPFIKMLFCRCLVAFTFALPLSVTMILSSNASAGYVDWTGFVWCILRWIGAIVALAIMDKLGRKFISLLGLLCMSVLMLVMAGLYPSPFDPSFIYDMNQISRLSIAFQFFAGIYIPCTSVYLAEAFPMRVKPYFIALIVCLEQMIHIIVIFNAVLYNYLLAAGIILLISTFIFAVLIPETRGLTLRLAEQRFRLVHNVKSY